MRFWWVNQNQTFSHEISGGYLWSPKRKANNAKNPFYESMREVAPGDLIFSFKDTAIPCIGVATSYCYGFPKPDEFGNAGDYWQKVGWKVDVNYHQLNNVIQPRNHMQVLQHLLPDKYSPIQSSGRGNQGVYLTELSLELANALIRLIGPEAQQLASATRAEENQTIYNQPIDGIVDWEEHITAEITQDLALPETERQALVNSRIGQGRFKSNVAQFEHRFRITKVDHMPHLRASHLKPWRHSTNIERLDGENGLLLTPSIDHLFDRGFISFEDSGKLIVSPVAHKPSLEKMGVPVSETTNVGAFTDSQKKYLDYHRDNIFLEKR